MTMTMKAPTRPPKPERRKRRYTRLPDPPKKVDMIHNRHRSRAQTMLERRYENDPTTLANGEGYLLLTAGERSGYVVPDCIVAFGVEADEIEKANGYVISEVGKPPDFVMEIASSTTGVRDYTVKRRIYRDLEVPEFWRFDYTGGRYHDAPLAGDILVDGEYRRIRIDADADGTFWGYSPALGLYLVWEAGKLRFYDPALGRFLRDLSEAEARIEESEARREEAEQEREEAEQEREEERAARIEAESEARAQAEYAAAERAARIEAESEARAQAEYAAAERAARIEAEAARAESEAELERLRRLLG